MQQRISPRTYERYQSARVGNRSLSFDQWVDQLFRQATGLSDADLEPVVRPQRGRPIGISRRGGLTGGMIRPHLLRLLSDAPGHAVQKSELIARLEKTLADRIKSPDRARSSAGIPRWVHRLLNEVASLRKKDVLEAENGDGYWRLTSRGVSFARGSLGADSA